MKYVVKRYWEICDEATVDADSVSAAIAAAHELPLENNRAEYVPDSLNSHALTDVQKSRL
jgi:hypothetical protein